MTGPVRDRGGSVALCIGIVDREQHAWPFTGELDLTTAGPAIERTIDEVFAHYAAQLSHLCFGYELDRYLAVATAEESQTVLALLKHAVDYASGHPLRRDKTAIGTALTLQGLLDVSSASLEEVVLGDEVVAVYAPLDERGALKAPESVVDELQAVLARFAARSGSRLPVTLLEVGYPSSKQTGSSEKAQQSFYQALFGLVDVRRDELGFVGVYGLADRSAADCEAEALASGDVADAELMQAWATTRCSMGLRAEQDKLAWPSVSAALSRYR